MARWVVVLLMLGGTHPAAAQEPGDALRLEVEPAIRANLGEVFRRDLRIHTGPGIRFDPQSLPVPARLEEGLELTASSWSGESRESEMTYRISLSYQAFRGIRRPERLQLPELVLRFSRDDRPLELTAPARDITLIPLIPPELPDERVTLKSPLPPVPEPADGIRRVLAVASGAMLSLLAYAAWQLALFPFHGRRRKPFARAWRELRGPLKKGANEAAFRIIHRALDQTAGYPMFADRLPLFLETHPVFSPLQEQFRRFFAASRQLFYAPANRPRQIGATAPYEVARELTELCRLAMELEQERR
ncbi:MAG: hypothetical protein FIA97_13125 [Methylococcaceae bacterium]|nr:hypothetical protein [Methylococcaceae bacterium]